MLRRYHRIVSLIIALPLALILLTGLILQLRQQFDFIQPQSIEMNEIQGRRLLTMDEIIQATKKNPEDIEQIIFKPKKFHLAIRLRGGDEIQLHPQTGKIFKIAHRYTNILIDLHQGSFFGTGWQYLVVLPTGMALVFLLVSGLIIYPWRKFQRGK